MSTSPMAQAREAPLWQRHLLGDSQSISSTCLLIAKAGHSNAPVLLLGETGTGKELAARMIHDVSGRNPFVAVDCSALPGSLLESELFGHVRGAFTGANSARKGLVEAASGGTAFFDEIGELPLDQQAKLLRLLQEKEFRRLGGTVAMRSDFRVIAATNRVLFEEVKRGRFREDLYYRLKVITVRLAPLRGHAEDIPVLVRHFLALYGCGQTVSPDVMQVLMLYHWPGNVRELANCIHAMVALNSNATLGMADLPEDFPGGEQHRQPTSHSQQTPSIDPIAESAASVPHLPLAELQRVAIAQALRRLHGHCGKAASALGIGRTTLYRKLKEYNIGLDGSTGNRETVTQAQPPVVRPAGPPSVWGPSHVTLAPALAPFARPALPPKGSAVEPFRLREVQYAAFSPLIFPTLAPARVPAAAGCSAE